MSGDNTVKGEGRVSAVLMSSDDGQSIGWGIYLFGAES